MKRDGFDGKKTLKTCHSLFHSLLMALTDTSPAPTTPVSTPSHSDLADIAATVSVVGVLMALLLIWLAVRLRRAGQSQSQSIPVVARRPASTASYTFRPSFAPSEASSKFGFGVYLRPFPAPPLTIPSPQAPPSLPPTRRRQLGLC